MNKSMQNGADFFKKNWETIAVVLAVIVGIYLLYKFFSKFGQTIDSLLGGITNQQQLNQQAVNSEQTLVQLGSQNPFDVSMYVSNPNAPHVLSDSEADTYATQLNDESGALYQFTHLKLDAGSLIQSTIYSLKYKVQVSQVSKKFFDKYGQDLEAYIKLNVENTGLLSSISGNNYSTYTDILNYVTSLPDGLTY